MNDWQGKQTYSVKTCPSAALSTTNPTWFDPGRCGEKPATNHLNYGKFYTVYNYWTHSSTQTLTKMLGQNPVSTPFVTLVMAQYMYVCMYVLLAVTASGKMGGGGRHWPVHAAVKLKQFSRGCVPMSCIPLGWRVVFSRMGCFKETYGQVGWRIIFVHMNVGTERVKWYAGRFKWRVSQKWALRFSELAPNVVTRM
jgi:hypothetical protein